MIDLTFRRLTWAVMLRNKVERGQVVGFYNNPG